MCVTQGQSVVQFVIEPYSSVYVTYLVIAFTFKFFDVVHLVISQCIVDVFLIDWERPDLRPPTSNNVSIADSLTATF